MRKPKTNNSGSGRKVSACAAAMDISRLQRGSIMSPQADLSVWEVGRAAAMPARPGLPCSPAQGPQTGDGAPVGPCEAGK